jgi:hypothetical protein
MNVHSGNGSLGRNRSSGQIGNTLAGFLIAMALLAGQSGHARVFLDGAFGFAHGMANKAAIAEGYHLGRLEFNRLVVMVNGVVRLR